MIHAIRRRHRIIWTVLAVLLTGLFAASIMFRHSEPVNDSVPRRELSEDQPR